VKTKAQAFTLITILALGSAPVWGDEVTMAFADKTPPYTFPETNSGIAVEVVREALAYRGHILVPQYFSVARTPVAFKERRVDATMSDLGQDLTADGGYYGDVAVPYSNVFLTLKSRGIEIKSPTDLKGLTVIAYPGAMVRYPEWLEPSQAAGNYREQNDQVTQVLTLNEGRYDVALSDRNIFLYFTLKLEREKGFVPKPVEEHQFLGQTARSYRPVFRSKSVRDDFNAGLQHEKETGRYQAIYDEYLK